MTAELIPYIDDKSKAEIIPIIKPDEALTADEFELAMQIARILSTNTATNQRSSAEFALYEAEQNDASAEVLQGLKHTVRLWRTVEIDTVSIPADDHHSAEYYEPED
jgi:hypothetical protein